MSLFIPAVVWDALEPPPDQRTTLFIHLPEYFLVFQEWLAKSAGMWEPSSPVGLGSPFCRPDIPGGVFFYPHFG